MSQLVRPRIHFLGTVETNVGTGNNDDTDRPPVVDTAAVTVDTRGMGDAQFRDWMEAVTTAEDGGSPGEVRGGWNYYGDNGCRVDASVTAVELVPEAAAPAAAPSPGAAAGESTGGGLIGARVTLEQAVMVDLDPTGFANTQIFADRFQIVAADGSRCSGRPSRMYSRWIRFRRNLAAGGFTGASAVFHGSIPADELSWQLGGSPAPAPAPALQAFHDHVASAAGLSIRLCLYLVRPRLGNDELAAEYAAGHTVSNPASGRLIGTVAPWLPGELASVAHGRLLVPTSSTIVSKVPVALGPAVAAVDAARSVVALDLVSTFPEVDATGAKVGLGEARLAVRAGTAVHDLGAVAYDQQAYEAAGGMAEVPYDAAVAGDVQSGELFLTVANGGELLTESAVMLESDDRCVYLEMGAEADVALSGLVRGAPPAGPLQFFVALEPAPAQPDDRVVEVPSAVEADGSGDVRLPVRALRPGCTIVRLALEPHSGRFDATTESYVNIRVLPADDYSGVPDDQLTFAFVYDNVFRYYHLLHPAMSKVMDMSDEAVWSNPMFAQSLRDRIDPAGWDRFSYMPRTRELSAGKRALLQRWCDKVTGA